jgi:ABC-type sugar transport system ATPase subunit
MAGLVGSGRTEIALGVIGARRVNTGDLMIDGSPRLLRSPGDAMRHGVVYVAEDRKDAVFYDKSIDFNIRASLLGPHRQGTRKRSVRETRHVVSQSIAKLGVKAESLDASARTLSGGNQQKLLFARAAAARPRLLILDEPTHGVDVGTRHEIHSIIRQFADDGMAVWVISSELDEVLDLADRIVVVREGRIAAEVPAGTDPTPVLAAALGTAATDQEITA